MTTYIVLNDSNQELKLKGDVIASKALGVYTDAQTNNSNSYLRYTEKGWENVAYVNGHLQWQAASEANIHKYFLDLSLKKAAVSQINLNSYKQQMSQIQPASGAQPVPNPPQPVPQQPKQPLPPSQSQPNPPQVPTKPQQPGGRVRPHPGPLKERDYTPQEFVDAMNGLYSDGQQKFIDEHIDFLLAKDSQYMAELLDRLINNTQNQNGKFYADSIAQRATSKGSSYVAQVFYKLTDSKAINADTNELLKNWLTAFLNADDLMTILLKTDAENWDTIFTEKQMAIMAPDAKSLGKVLSKIDAKFWPNFFSIPGAMNGVKGQSDFSAIIDGINEGRKAQPQSENQFAISDVFSDLFKAPQVQNLFYDLSSVIKAIPTLPAGGWESFIGKSEVNKYITDIAAVGKVCASIPVAEQGAFLKHGSIAPKINAADPKAAASLLSNYVLGGGKVSALASKPEFIALLQDIAAVAATVAVLPAGGVSAFLLVPEVLKLIADFAAVGKLLAAVKAGDQAAILGSLASNGKLNDCDYTGLSQILAQLPIGQRAGLLGNEHIKALMAVLNSKSDVLGQVGHLLNVLPIPPNSAWSDFLKNDFPLNTMTVSKFGEMLKSLPQNHWNAPYIKDFLNTHEIASRITAASLEAVLKALDPAQRTSFLANCDVARNIYTGLVASSNHGAIWKLMELTQCTPEDKKSLFEATLQGYQLGNKKEGRFRLSYFNKLGNAKLAVVSKALGNSNNDQTDFDALYDKVEKAHDPLAAKANHSWFTSNRWKLHVGKSYGETNKKAWNENVDSKLGKIMTKFRKP